jgi:hypothetical protein
LLATLAVQASSFKLRISANLWENLRDSFLDSKGASQAAFVVDLPARTRVSKLLIVAKSSREFSR